jgi:ribonucleotide reductase alpha subunit
MSDNVFEDNFIHSGNDNELTNWADGITIAEKDIRISKFNDKTVLNIPLESIKTSINIEQSSQVVDLGPIIKQQIKNDIEQLSSNGDFSETIKSELSHTLNRTADINVASILSDVGPGLKTNVTDQPKNNTFEELSIERKKLQDKGYLPEWYTTQAWQMFKEKYMYEDTALLGRHRTLARTAAAQLPPKYRDEWEDKFFNELWDGILSPSSPTLANTGTTRGLNVACSGQDIQDTIESFYDNLKESAILSKYAFGTSGDFTKVRPRGAPISKGGVANGVREVIDDFFVMAKKVAQGGNRRGSFAAYIDIEHEDWDECIDDLLINTDGKNYGWTIRNSFIEKLKAGDKEAARRFQKALYIKLITGKGYYFFIDKANDHRPQMYKDKNLDIKATNLCFTGDTIVAVADGRNGVSIKQLAEESNGIVKFPVYTSNNDKLGYSGAFISDAIAFKTGTKKVIKVKLSDGGEFRCTPDHKLIDTNGNKVEAKDSLGLELQSFFSYATQHQGCYRTINSLSDGYKKQHLMIWRYLHDDYIPDNHVIDHINPSSPCRDSINNLRIIHRDQEDFSGRDGAGKRNSQFCGVDNFKLIELSKQWKMDNNIDYFKAEDYWNMRNYYLETGEYKLPSSFSNYRFGKSWLDYVLYVNNQKQYLGEYDKKDWIDTARIGSQEVYDLVENQLRVRNDAGNITNRKGLYVTEVIDTNEVEDVYCLNVAENNKFYLISKDYGTGFNNTTGVLVTQCTEIMLHSSEEYTYSCVLASLNLIHWDKIKERNSVFIATVFLDCIVSDFLEKSKDIKGMEKIRSFTEKGRAIGLGVMGLHTLFQMKRLPMDRIDAGFLNHEIFTHLHDESLRASKWLAEILGEPEWCKGYGVRNTHRTALAPTKSTSVLMGGVSEGINPDPGMVFDSASSVGELERIVPELYKLMKERGVYNPETVKRIISNLGSVQNETWLTDEEKLVFRNGFELNQKALFRMAVSRQPKICQGQSLNFNVPGEDSEEMIADLISMCFMHPDCLSQYYIYSRNGVVIKDECISCSA